MSNKQNNIYEDESRALLNGDSKARIKLSQHALITLSDDISVFNIDNITQYVNLILEKYSSEADASFYQKRSQKINNIINALSSTDFDFDTKKAIAERIVDADKNIKSCREIVEKTLKSNGESKLYYINNNVKNKCIDRLYKEYNNDDEPLSIYYRHPNKYFRAVIEEFCNLPLIKRIEIIKKDVFAFIESAIKEKYIIYIPNPENSENPYVVYPYKICANTTNTQKYLVCYSRKMNENEADKKIASFSIARLNISENNTREETFKLSNEELKYIENIIQTEPVDYIIGESQTIKVRLTKKGKAIYRSRLYMRPHRENIDSDNDIWTFRCTQRQAFNFFFSFAEDVEIIEPLELRNQFIQKIQNMTKVYNIPDTEN